jgi:hypothetical protein
MNLRKSILKNLLLLILIAPVAVFSQSDTLEIPFIEDWSSGLLETNGWIADTNWIINTEMGNAEPSVEFDTRGEDSYFGELTSSVFKGSELTEGNVWLSFDLKMETNDSAHRAWLDIEINYGGSSWHKRKSFKVDSGSYDWSHQKIDLTDFAVGYDFQIRFSVTAWDGGVQFWAVDNIHVFRTCPSPYRFAVESIDTIEYDKYRLNFSWQMDEPDPGEWLHWDNGINDGAVGATYNMSVSARWDEGQLTEYNGFKLQKMKAFIFENYFDSIIFKVWEGENAASLIYYDTIYEITGDAWVEHELDSNIFIDASKELWVGYSARNMAAGTFTFGMDSGPQIEGFGNMIRFDVGIPPYEWETLSSLLIYRNWNIQFYVEDTAGNEMQVGKSTFDKQDRNPNLSGYNLYQSINGEEYELLEFIPWVPGDTSHTIMFDASPDLYCYQLTALWESETDTCESAPAISKDNPDEDFVCVLLVGNEENIFGQSDLLRCFPNPFSNATTVEYTLQQASSVQITIFNHLGEQVDYMQQKQSSGKQQMIWDAKNHPAGMYYLLLQTEKESMTGKMMIVR